MCTDQGAERGICDETVRVLGDFAASPFSRKDAYLFPKALWVPGHLHILFNALEEACKKIEISSTFFAALTSIIGLFGEPDLRRKFQNDCCRTAAERAEFNVGGRHHVDWRWEFMGPAIAWVLDHWDTIRACWDRDKMSFSESGSLKRAVILEVDTIIKEYPQFELHGEMFKAAGELFERWAGSLEGCECHADIWRKKRRWDKILDEIEADTGRRHCVWKGRQGAWWVAEGRLRFIGSLMSLSSVGFESRLRKCTDADAKRNALKWMDRLRNTCAEIIGDKLAFWDHIPWKGIGIYHAELGGSLERSKQVCRECIAEWDKALAEVRRQSLHRVAERLFSPETLCGQQLRDFVADTTGKPLHHYPDAYIRVQEYALLTLVERRVESIHAVIKRLLKKHTFITPPQLCAELRESDNMRKLETVPAFRAFCIDNWRSRKLVHDLLSQRLPPATLEAMSLKQKIQTVYQCTLACEFEDSREAHVQSARFSDSRQLDLPSPPAQPSTTGVAAAFLKSLFVHHEFFAMPFQQFMAWRQASSTEEPRLEGAFPEQILETAELALPEPAPPFAVFQVINAHSERRFHTPVPQMIRSRQGIIVGECLQVAWRGGGASQLVCQRPRALFLKGDGNCVFRRVGSKIQNKIPRFLKGFEIENKNLPSLGVKIVR